MNAANIPIATPYIAPSTTVPLPVTETETQTVSSTEQQECIDFVRWGKAQFLQPGMITLALVPTAKVVLATASSSATGDYGSTVAGSSQQQMPGLEPVLHHAQRYCVVVSSSPNTPSASSGSDRVVVFDGVSHHVVTSDLCSIICPPLVATPPHSTQTQSREISSSLASSSEIEMKMLCLWEIWKESDDPRQVVLDLCHVCILEYAQLIRSYCFDILTVLCIILCSL